MNDNNNKKKNIKIDGVSVLSFVVAAFVIVSMVALGFNQVSYAAPDVTGDPDKYSDLLKNGFTTKEFDNSSDRLYSDSGSSFGIDMHFAELSCTSGDACKGGKMYVPLFCIEQTETFNDGETYARVEQNAITDTGLIYLLANLYPNTELQATGNIEGDNSDKKIETWLTQAAIWYYLSKVDSYSPETNNLTDDQLNNFLKAHYLLYGENNSIPDRADKVGYVNKSNTLFDGYKSNEYTVKQVLNNALSKHNAAMLTLNVQQDGKYSVSEDKKYYFSSLATVQATVNDPSLGVYEGYNVNLSNAPEGTVITDEEGAVIEKPENINPGKKFFVRVPYDKVSEATRIRVDVTANYDSVVGDVYQSTGDYQDVTALRMQPIIRNTGFEFEIVPAPDTGSSTAQTIYFVGLIVLLCGVGIIYANAKATAKE